MEEDEEFHPKRHWLKPQSDSTFLRSAACCKISMEMFNTGLNIHHGSKIKNSSKTVLGSELRMIGVGGSEMSGSACSNGGAETLSALNDAPGFLCLLPAECLGRIVQHLRADPQRHSDLHINAPAQVAGTLQRVGMRQI